MPGLICLREKLWTRTYSIGDQVPTCPVFTRAKIKSHFGILVNLPSQWYTDFNTYGGTVWCFYCPTIYVIGLLLKSKWSTQCETTRTKEHSKQSSTNKIKFIYQEMRIVIRQYVEKLITTIQVKGIIYWEVDTIAFRFCWTIIRAMRGDINNFELTMDV